MKLSTLEKLVLRIVAQDEHYERLDLVLSELRQHLPGTSDDKALETARRTLDNLILKGLVELYRRERHENAEFEPLPKSAYHDALSQRESWFWRESAPCEIGAAPTTEGQKAYEQSCKIP